MMKRCDVAIVGGGFAGVYAAWRLARDGASVVLIESSDHLGGSLWSWEWRGFLIDPGAHNFDLRSQIGAEFYEDILGPNLFVSDVINWGSTTGQTWTHGFEMPDFSQDDPAFCAKALDELKRLSQHSDAQKPLDYDEWLLANFGLTLATRLKPMVEKTIGYESSGLAVEAQAALSMFARPKLGSDEEMVALKLSDKFFDDRLGVSLAVREPQFLGKSAVRKFGYPSRGALRSFCSSAEKRLKDLGVTILKQTTVDGIEARATELALRVSRGWVSADRAFWSLPEHGLTKVLNIDLDTRKAASPVGSAFYAFEVHQRDILGPDYLQDFSPRTPYRYNSCGVYSNQIRRNGSTFVMAEVPSHPSRLSTLLCADAMTDAWHSMRESGFIRSNAECGASGFWGYPVAYTLPLVGWRAVVKQISDAVHNVSDRISTIEPGHRGRHAFMMHFDTKLQYELNGC